LRIRDEHGGEIWLGDVNILQRFSDTCLELSKEARFIEHRRTAYGEGWWFALRDLHMLDLWPSYVLSSTWTAWLRDAFLAATNVFTA
jgi:hypothetical protein